MRWKYRRRHEGDYRIIKRFLLFPRRITGEARWLETAYIEQELCRGFEGDYWWRDTYWSTRGKYDAQRRR